MPSPDDTLSIVFAALADPTRRAILARGRRRGARDRAGAAVRNVRAGRLKHLRVLAEAGLIEREVNARWRICHLRAEALRGVHDWLDSYRRHWEGNLDRLVEYVEGTSAAGSATGGRATANKTRGNKP